MKISKVANNTRCEIVDVGLKALTAIVTESTWSPSTFIDNYRIKANFASSEVLGLDFDEGLDLAVAVKLFADYKHIIGTTKSHQIDKNGKVCDRFRVILFLEAATSDAKVYEATVAQIMGDFPNADQACKDASRQFYPCKDIVSINEYGNLVKLESVVAVQVPRKNFSKVSRGGIDKDVIKKISRLDSYVQEILMDPPENGAWHVDMLKVWNCFAKHEIPIDDAIDYINRYITMDEKDIYQLKDAYKKNYFPKPVEGKKKRLTLAEYQSVSLDKLDYEFRNKYIVVADVKGARRLLEIYGNNEVKPTFIDNVAGDVILSNRGTEYLANFSSTKQLVNSWVVSNTVIHDNPPSVAFKNTTHYTYSRLKFDPVDGPSPCFDRIMDNLNNSDAMKAYIWSTLEPDSYKQQMVWWYGLGGDGKGSISRVLQKIFGIAYAGTSSGDYTNNKAFYFDGLVGKRVVVFSDENNSRLLMTNWFKRITGDDAVTINPKGEKSYTATLDAKILVFSNREPDFDNTKAHIRRIIYCTPKDTLEYDVDPKFEEKLLAELPHILYKCKQKYQELTKNHGPIMCDIQDAKEIGSAKDNDKYRFFSEHFEFDLDSSLRKEDVQNFVEKRSNLIDFSYKDFIQYLKISGNVKDYRPAGKRGEKRPSLFKGIKFKK